MELTALDLTVYLTATFAAALVTGIAGFAFGVATFAMSALWLGVNGMVSTGTVLLFLLGLPALIFGSWLGLQLDSRVDEAKFRQFILVLLLVLGVALIF